MKNKRHYNVITSLLENVIPIRLFMEKVFQGAAGAILCEHIDVPPALICTVEFANMFVVYHKYLKKTIMKCKSEKCSSITLSKGKLELNSKKVELE